jgi:single-strand DNA-binding protein
MSRRRPPPMPAEQTAYLRQLRRALRDDEIRRGKRRPRSMREMEIWRDGMAERDERAAAGIARAQRSGGGYSGGKGGQGSSGGGRQEDPWASDNNGGGYSDEPPF